MLYVVLGHQASEGLQQSAELSGTLVPSLGNEGGAKQALLSLKCYSNSKMWNWLCEEEPMETFESTIPSS